MTNVSLILVTVADRQESCAAMCDTVAQYLPNTYNLCVLSQQCAVSHPRITHQHTVPHRLGPFVARHVALARWHAHTYILVDDDMRLLPETNYAPAIERTRAHGVGLVSTRWVRSPMMLEAARQRTKHAFVHQPIVYVGGGMVFGDEIANIIREESPLPYWSSDVAFSLASYLAGYRNERYLGSLAIHRVVSSGGRKAWIQHNTDVVMPPQQYITTPRGAREYHIPTASNLTRLARETHQVNRKQLLGALS